MGIRIGSTTGYTDEMMQIVVSKAKEMDIAQISGLHRIR